MTIQTARTIFMVGIGGSGMRGLAYLLQAQNKKILGSDNQHEKLVADPEFAAYTLVPPDQAATAITQAELLIYSDAVPEDHPVRVAARQHKLTELMYTEAVGQLSSSYTTIAVTGTHGKSSTTAMLAHIFTELDLDPTVIVGASVPAWDGRNARVGQSQYFIIEADEYRNHFLHLHPHHAIITNIEFDHPDYFASLDAVLQSFSDFLQLVPDGGHVVTPTAVRTTYAQLPWPASTISVDPPTTDIALALPGEHMQYNAQLALTLTEKLGLNRQAAEIALQTFPGLGRRFEFIKHVGALAVYSDYGHHPAEITATLLAARAKFPQQKIVAIVEPHMAERLNALFDEFVDCLLTAPIDGLVICPTFKAVGRTTDMTDRNAELYDRVKAKRPDTWQLTDYAQLPTLVEKLVLDFNVAIGFTAGSLDEHLRHL